MGKWDTILVYNKLMFSKVGIQNVLKGLLETDIRKIKKNNVGKNFHPMI